MPGLPSNQAASFLAGLVLFAAVGAIALAELELECRISSEMEASPYIFPGGRRFERYKKWELPQVRELYSWIRRLGHTKVPNSTSRERAIFVILNVFFIFRSQAPFKGASDFVYFGVYRLPQ
jgi:hypothetical protein